MLGENMTSLACGRRHEEQGTRHSFDRGVIHIGCTWLAQSDRCCFFFLVEGKDDCRGNPSPSDQTAQSTNLPLWEFIPALRYSLISLSVPLPEMSCLL